MFEKLGIAKTDEELQKIQHTYCKYDEMYIKFCVVEKYENEKECFHKIYSQYNKYLDNNFISGLKVKGSFNQRLWELYLLGYLKKLGYNLVEILEDKGPDFKVEFENINIWIECVASTKGTGNNELKSIENGYTGDLNKVNIPRILRLTTSLDEKRRKFNKYIDDNIVKNNDICIIALNGGESDGNFIDNGIVSVLYGVGRTKYINRGGNLEGPYYEKRDNVYNINGASVNTSIFNNEDYNSIDGIIYISSSIYNINDYNFEGKNNNSYPVDKLVFIKNPNSKKEIPEGFLNNITLKINVT